MRLLYTNTTGVGNTANGALALVNNTTGSSNTANGSAALVSNTTGGNNTANGYASLYSNTTGGNNTANGYASLYSNTTGGNNTASGFNALYYNTTGASNTASGFAALFNNTTGNGNTAAGVNALFNNTSGTSNVAFGGGALNGNTSGGSNTAVGYQALNANATGINNTVIGYQAGLSSTGNNNLFLGLGAGNNLTAGNNNIEIGTPGVAGDASTTRIGSSTQTQAFITGIYGVAEANSVAVYINGNGQLGTLASSERFKTDIRDMNEDSSVLYSLRPVSFHYKQQIDPKGIAQGGLIAEEVEKIDPALVAHDSDGKPYSVRYEQINAMLLNEFLKEHTRTQEQAAGDCQARSGERRTGKDARRSAEKSSKRRLES